MNKRNDRMSLLELRRSIKREIAELHVLFGTLMPAETNKPNTSSTCKPQALPRGRHRRQVDPTLRRGSRMSATADSGDMDPRSNGSFRSR